MANAGKMRALSASVARREASVCEAARMGWLDAMYGRGFAPAYDAAPEAWQHNYETARGAVAYARAAKLLLPGWPAGAALPDAIARIVMLAQASGAVLPISAERRAA